MSATDGADWIGLVVGCDWSLADHSYTLTLLALGWRVGVYVREVGPAAVVTSWNAGTKTLTVEPATFAGAPDDPSTFIAGDDVHLCAPTLEPYAIAPVSVTATTSTTITLSAVPAVTPAAGDVLMCAYTNEFSNFTRYPATARPYAALADSSLLELEEEDGSISPPDIYGSSVAGGGA